MASWTILASFHRAIYSASFAVILSCKSETLPLHAYLAAIQRDQRAVQRARLDYYPDPTLGVTWIDTATTGISPVANGRDAVLLGVGFNMPIYRKRIEAGVREAEAQTVADTRRYDSLKDRTQEQVKDLFVRSQSQRELLQLFREDIIPTAACGRNQRGQRIH